MCSLQEAHRKYLISFAAQEDIDGSKSIQLLNATDIGGILHRFFFFLGPRKKRQKISQENIYLLIRVYNNLNDSKIPYGLEIIAAQLSFETSQTLAIGNNSSNS